MTSAASSRVSVLLDFASVILLAVAIFVFVSSRKTPLPPARPSLSADSTFRPLPLIRSDGQLIDPVSVTSGDASQRTLLLVFRTDCPVCARQRPFWDSTASRAARAGIRSLAISPERMDSLLPQYFPPSVPVSVTSLRDPDDFTRLLQTDAVPTTIVLGTSGRVLFHHRGLLSQADADTLVRQLGL